MQGSGSHLAVPGSDLSNQMELAKHHTPATELGGEQRKRQAEEAQWVRGVQMVDNNSYMLATFPPALLIGNISSFCSVHSVRFSLLI